jgi:hypothetical protein
MAQHSLALVGQRIRAEVDGLTAGPQRRYPARLRRRIVAYAEQRVREGVARARVGAELGVSDPTLTRLLGVAARGHRLRPVRVLADAPASSTREKVVVRGPGGIVVEGLDVAGVAALLQALS